MHGVDVCLVLWRFGSTIIIILRGFHLPSVSLIRKGWWTWEKGCDFIWALFLAASSGTLNCPAGCFVHGLRDGQRYGACLWSSCGMCVLREAIFNDHDVTNFLSREFTLFLTSLWLILSIHASRVLCFPSFFFFYSLSLVYGHLFVLLH